MSLAPQTPFQWLTPAQSGVGLVPAVGYKVKWYEAGTTTPKIIYTDAALSVPYPAPSNTAVLDDEGRALIYLSAGGYKMVVTTPLDSPVYTQDNINGGNNFGTGFAANFAALTSVNTALNSFCYIPGYYTSGDGGEGMFYLATSSASPDGGYVQSSDDSSRRWLRVPDENGDVRAASFGYCGAGVRTDELLAADAYAVSIGARLRIQLDVCTSSSIMLGSSLVFNQTAALNANGTATLVVYGVVEAGGWNLFSSWTSVTLSYNQESRPEWLGATLSADPTANAAAFAKWKASNAGVFVVPPGTWPHTGTFTPVADRITIFIGSVGDRPSGTFYGPASLLSGNLSLTLTGTFGLTGPISLTGNATLVGNLTQTGNQNITGDLILSGLATVGGLTSLSDVSASNIVQGGEVHGTGNVIAGFGDLGYLSQRAGSSATFFKAGGNGQVALGNGSASLGAGALGNNGDYIKIVCSGFITATTGPNYTVTVGAAQIFSATLNTFAATGSPWSYQIVVYLFRTGATTYYSTGTVTMATAGTGSYSAAANNRVSPTNGNITWANTNAITHAGTSATKELTMYEIYPVT
jgi:hypothetical protein